MGRFIDGADRRQATLLPETLEDYVSEDNPVRVVDAFVDALDLSELDFDDTEHHLIVAHEVTNVGIDKGHLGSIGGKAREALGAVTIEALADSRPCRSSAGSKIGIMTFQTLAADPVRCLPQRHQRVLDDNVVGRRALLSRLRCGRRPIGQRAHRVLAMPASHLAQLVENPPLLRPPRHSVAFGQAHYEAIAMVAVHFVKLAMISVMLKRLTEPRP